MSNREWRDNCEIIEGYKPPHGDNVRAFVVRHNPTGMFLRYSKGPLQGHFWDIYGDDYHTHGLANHALYSAPPPPRAAESQLWGVLLRMRELIEAWDNREMSSMDEDEKTATKLVRELEALIDEAG